MVMWVWHIKMMDSVAIFVAVIENLRTRTGVQAKIEASLRPLTARLYAYLHDTFSNGRAIAKSRHMMNSVVHLYLHISANSALLARVISLRLCGSSFRQGNIDRIDNVHLEDSVMDLGALASDILQVGMHIVYYIFYLIVLKPRTEAPCQSLDAPGVPRMSRLGDRMERGLDLAGGETNR